MCLVSVIIPAYNTEKYIRHCVESILHQTLKDFEIIIINDGSTDSTASIVEEFSQIDKRVRIIHQSNQGIGAARQNGLLRARGKYIQFIDSDDWIDEEYLDIMSSVAELTNADIVDSSKRISKNIQKNKTSSITIQKNELTITEVNARDISKMIVERHHSCAVWSKMMKKNFLDSHNLKFEKGIDFGEDAFFICQTCYYQPRYVIINKQFYHQSDNPTSTTKTKFRRDKFLCRINWVNRLDKFCDDNEFRISLNYMKFFIKEEAALSQLYSQDEYSQIFPEIITHLNSLKLGFLRKMGIKYTYIYDNKILGKILSFKLIRKFILLEDKLYTKLFHK